MNTTVYTCPCCGAPLAYSSANGKLECSSCGNSYEPEVLETMNPADKRDGI